MTSALIWSLVVVSFGAGVIVYGFKHRWFG